MSKITLNLHPDKFIYVLYYTDYFMYNFSKFTTSTTGLIIELHNVILSIQN